MAGSATVARRRGTRSAPCPCRPPSAMRTGAGRLDPADAVVEEAMADSRGPPVWKHGLQAQRSVHPPSRGLRRAMDLRPPRTGGEDFDAAFVARARHGMDVHGEARFVASLGVRSVL